MPISRGVWLVVHEERMRAVGDDDLPWLGSVLSVSFGALILLLEWYRLILSRIERCVKCRYIFTSPAGAVVMYSNEQVCVCVCLCVCPRAYLTCDLYQIFCACCLLPWLSQPHSGGVTKSQGKGKFWGVSFLPHRQCIVQHSIWDPYKNGWTDRDAIWVCDSGGP